MAWLSFSCKSESFNSRGESFALCSDVANSSDQIVAVGVNCVAPKHVIKLLEIARKVTNKPLLAYPNSGETWDSSLKQWFSDSSCGTELSGDLAATWLQMGCKLIGGCCRTTPLDIKSIADSLQKFRSET